VENYFTITLKSTAFEAIDDNEEGSTDSNDEDDGLEDASTPSK